MTDGSPDVLVLGLGNLLLTDDGLGLRLCELLAESGEFATHPVEFVDGGTQGMALLGRLENRSAIVILDAVGLGAPAGTLHVLRGAELERLRAHRATTAHEGNALELLQTAQLLGETLGPVTVVGIEPGTVCTGIGLTREVEEALPGALAAARTVLHETL